MKEYKVKVIVLNDGRVVLEGVPVVEGQEIEVTIKIEDPVLPAYPLWGLPFRLDDPFGPAVDPSEWNVLK
ncbi:MAG TPA: hypothetical protein VN380_04170 [Thermoanaerobaculia bacterium]|jgi:hypothetical protein|nr:hypothetical protein [Thermoanaerobaculia bacterium]